jgi:RNA polymerase sigma-70 factor (ECF subfamily)
MAADMAAERAVVEAVADAHRREWAAVLAATVRVTRDLDLAEECAQDAYARALRSWPRSGVPARPGAWLTTVAANRARDLLRRESAWRRALPLLVVDDAVPGPGDGAEPAVIADDRLRLVFTCCHPALAPQAQVALTLRLVCGLSTAEVAHAFLVREATMAARITRAKKKIAAAAIPYRVPAREELPERVEAVCEVVHLLARMLHRLLPGAAGTGGLLALLLLVDARRAARVSASGAPVLLEEQDRGRWDRARIDEGVALLTRALRDHRPTRYTVQAAIAAVHAQAPSWAATDWGEIVGLYDVLRRLWPSPVVELNRAVAVGLRDGPRAGLDALAPLLDDPALATYGYLSAARADFLRRLGRWPQAATAYEEALTLTGNTAERAFLTRRLDEALRRAAHGDA